MYVILQSMTRLKQMLLFKLQEQARSRKPHKLSAKAGDACLHYLSSSACCKETINKSSHTQSLSLNCT